jgi:hypothetical protein
MCWMVNATPRPLCYRETLVPIAQETGWAPGPVGTSEENLDPTSIRSPDRPSRSKLLYRLRYYGSHFLRAEVINKLFFALWPNTGHGLLSIHEVSRSHTTMHHSWYDFCGLVTSPPYKPLPHNAQHLQESDIHAFSGIRTHKLSMRPAADLPLRPRGHWYRQISFCYTRQQL